MLLSWKRQSHQYHDQVKSAAQTVERKGLHSLTVCKVGLRVGTGDGLGVSMSATLAVGVGNEAERLAETVPGS